MLAVNSHHPKMPLVMTHKEIPYQKERRPRTLKNGKEKEEHLRKRKLTRKKQGKGGERRDEDWRQGSIGKRDRRRLRREGICWARAVPSQGCTRNRRLQQKTRNSEKAHNRGLGDCKTNAS